MCAEWQSTPSLYAVTECEGCLQCVEPSVARVSFRSDVPRAEMGGVRCNNDLSA